jgi:hypothetical protein
MERVFVGAVAFALAGCLTVQAALVGHWTFDETNGTNAADSSGGGHDGSVVNPIWTSGLIGGALELDGTCNVSGFGGVLADTATELSLSVWCFGDASQSDGNLFSAYFGGGRKLNCHFPYSNGRIYFDANSSSTRDRIDKAYSSADESLLWGNWSHWVFTKNVSDGSMKIYVNGALWHSGTGLDDPMETAADFFIGSDGNDLFYRGLLDDFRVYDHELSTTEISALYDASAPPYALVLEPLNGYRVPRIMGATANTAMLTGFDYLDWWGVTEHRSWFKPAFSTLTDDSGITSAAAFEAATEAIRQDPARQGTSSDYFLDWDHLYSELNDAGVPEHMQYLADHDVTAMVVNSRDISSEPITDDWETIFRYWKTWYAMVYYYASEWDVAMYQYRNEPHAWISYDVWESHWLVCADAMRKAIEDVNRDFGKSLVPNFAGPVCPGVYWDYSLTEPYDKEVEGSDPHGWGSLSWTKVKYDIYGNYDVNNPMNYGSYDYHRYGDAAGSETIMLSARADIATAQNDPSSDIALVISEYNTNTGGTFNSKELDTEDLYYGITMAQILHASAVHGPDGLGDDGGIFIFKLGASEGSDIKVGVGNKLSYTSSQSPENYGGITRGGACFQLYASHFNGGKPLFPVSVLSGADDERRTLAALDEEKGMVYIYGSNCSGEDTPVSIDLSAVDVEVGAIASLQRVDEYNTGQVKELLTVDESNTIEFYAPDFIAYLIKVPLAGTVPYRWEVSPVEDTTQRVSDSGNLGASSTLNVSTHHSDAAQRNVGLLRFRVDSVANMGQALLKLSGRNIGTDQSEREILHVYAVTDEEWSEDDTLAWADAPGLGQYHIDETTMGTTDGTGDMVDIEDNHAGYTSGAGTGLGLYGEFVGAVSFYSSDYEDNYLDVTETLKSVADDEGPVDVTFVVARAIRYNVNEYSNSYYKVGEYHYDGRKVEIASKEHDDVTLQPALICSAGLPPVLEAEAFSSSHDAVLWSSSDVGEGEMVELSGVGSFVSFPIHIAESGSYLAGFRVASSSGAVQLELTQDGTPVTAIERVIDSGEVWTTLYKMVALQAGVSTLTVLATADELQWLNWIDLTSSDGLFDGSIPADLTNLALNKPASASHVHSAGYDAAKAVDGDLNTRWATSVLTPWMEVDFGAPVLISGSRIVETRDRIRSYEIQVYNGSWETVFVGGNPSDDSIEAFSPVMASKARLQISAATDNPTIEEWELVGAAFDPSSSFAVSPDSISFEWSNFPGVTYAVQRSTNLMTDAFSTTIESGIPAMTETNKLSIKIQNDSAAFYRIIAE